MTMIDVPAEPAKPHVRDIGSRIRHFFAWFVPPIAVLGLIRFAKWWGDESQDAMLHGRKWPPEPLMVFLGH